jgi:hypothetical protein
MNGSENEEWTRTNVACYNETQCLRYNWAALFTGYINKGIGPSRVGSLKFQAVKYGYKFGGTLALE